MAPTADAPYVATAPEANAAQVVQTSLGTMPETAVVAGDLLVVEMWGTLNGNVGGTQRGIRHYHDGAAHSVVITPTPAPEPSGPEGTQGGWRQSLVGGGGFGVSAREPALPQATGSGDTSRRSGRRGGGDYL